FQEVTPIVVNGVMYMPSGNRVVALEPDTGKEIWRYELPEGLASFRGVAYWPGDGRLPARIFFTSLKKLMAVRADTGALDVSLDAETGRLKWHFQNIRHELWDYNLPPAPGLIDIRRDGRTIPALAQVGKSGWMFILNRETGTPIYGIDERPQAKADVPGEWY